MAFHMREATAGDIPSLRDVFFDAFSEDPISSRIFPRSSPFAQAEILDTFAHSLAEPDVRVFVVTEEPAPAESESESEAAATTTTDKKDAVLGYVDPTPPPPPAPDTDGAKALALAQDFFEVMERKHREHMGGAPHWHLAFIGVRQRAQGRGVARQLIQWGLDRADEEGVECYVQSSPMAAARYRRYGFEDMDSHHFALAGDYHEVFMKRKPQPRKQQKSQQQQQQQGQGLTSSKDAQLTPGEVSQLFKSHGGAREEQSQKSVERFDHAPSVIAQVG
ncbi:hypothetical protein PG996_003099 [Apiospora saccharicola]|uniref:N-acetyltransferase domain-containing protein n=1 Tax=Apiospora saccharicola TaxID=335842 RepID=A0ABR1W0B0_9PEZI